ncbi:hypothetical protein ACIOD2_32280 [Amycolatopsis sp. NPDC088138]|uniref:hypothetical protein n=1 Tax=Amycolatopsis sp. NPDC088138 TaxID=3363938 RepID=UPI0038121C8D
MSTCTTPGHEDRHRPEHQFICGGCVNTLKSDLDDATTLWDELTITLTRQDVIGGDGGRRSAETSLAFKANASEAMWVLASSFGNVAGDLADVLGMQFPLHPVRWLGANLDKLAGTAEAGRLVDEIRSAVRLAWATIDRPPELLFAGPCRVEGCEATMKAKPGDVLVECPECGAGYEVAERRQWMIDAAAVRRVTKRQALSWVSLLMDRSIPDGTWRQWRSRGRLRVHALSAEGSELFRFGDVRDLAINWMSRKKAA